MSWQKKLKQFHKELDQIRRKNQIAEATYFAEKYEVFPAVAEESISEEDMSRIANLKQFNACDMQSLIFIGNNFDAWLSKIKSFLKSANLWNFVENGFENPQDEATNALALYLIQQSLDDSIFLKIAATNASKEAWDILNEEFNVGGSSTNIVVSQNVEDIVKPTEVEPKQNVDGEAHYHNSHVDDEFKDETDELMYDEENLSDEEWFKIMQEKKLIDNLLNGREHLLEIVNDDESAVAVENNVVDSFLVKAKYVIYEENDALVIEQDEKKNDEKFVLANIFKFVDN